MRVTRIGIDLAKQVFQVHGVDRHGKVVIRKQLTRGKMRGFFAQLPSCLIGIEACASAHSWGREIPPLITDVNIGVLSISALSSLLVDHQITHIPRSGGALRGSNDQL